MDGVMGWPRPGHGAPRSCLTLSDTDTLKSDPRLSRVMGQPHTMVTPDGAQYGMFTRTGSIVRLGG